MKIGMPREALILLIEDDSELCSLMQEYFGQNGMEVEIVSDGRRGLARALEGNHDLVLLDVMLPGIDGFEVLKLLRRRRTVPVIMLTARTAPHDRIAGLDGGADDYLPKPFGPDELLARIRAVLRRAGQVASRNDSLEAGPVRVNGSAREAWVDGRPVELTGLEFDILEFLVRQAGQLVSRDQLMTVLYQREANPFERSLDVHISHLRKKLAGHRDLIRTVRGSGYMFCVPEGVKA
jgi:two-component system response regulator CpxR